MAEEKNNPTAEQQPVEQAKEQVSVAVEATPAAHAESPANEPASKPERTPKEIFYERVRTSRPDGKYDEDEEDYFRSASSMMDDLEKKGGEFDKMTQKIMGRFNQNPEEASAFLDFLDGMPLIAAIRKNMGDEALTMKEGAEGWDEYQKAGEERMNRMKEMQGRVDEYKKNAEESEKALKDFAAERGMSEEEAAAFGESVLAMYNDMLAGKISKDFLNNYKRSLDYDKDIASAREQGMVDGKNEKIAIEKKRMAGSGLPDANAGGEAEREVEKKSENPTADFLKKLNHR